MIYKKIRKILTEGDSKAITLPPDWYRGLKTSEKVELWYADVVIILPIDGLSEERKKKLIHVLQG